MPEQAVGDLPEAGSRRARVRGMDCLEPAGQLKMAAGDGPLPDEGGNDGELLFEGEVIRQVETKGNRPPQDGALNNVKSERRAVAVDEHVLADRTADDAAGLPDHLKAAIAPAAES